MRFWILFVILVANQLQGSSSNNPDLAHAFLGSLTDLQKEKIQFVMDDSSRRAWHYLPATMWSREGLPLGDLDAVQKERFFVFLRASLSESGYDKVRQIIALETVLAELENNPVRRDPDKYYIAVYGDPGDFKPWAWSFEGHHVSLNFTVTADGVSMVPRFLGANPAEVRTGPSTGLRTLQREEDLGLELVNSLSDEQRKEAIFSKIASKNFVSRNLSRIPPPQPVGIHIKHMTADQEKILLSLINEYISTMPEDLARQRSERLQREDYHSIWFGWAGESMLGIPHYYRIQGKTFLIEFDNTQNKGNHIHSVWREFEGDFGEDLIHRHYETSDHHH